MWVFTTPGAAGSPVERCTILLPSFLITKKLCPRPSKSALLRPSQSTMYRLYVAALLWSFPRRVHPTSRRRVIRRFLDSCSFVLLHHFGNALRARERRKRGDSKYDTCIPHTLLFGRDARHLNSCREQRERERSRTRCSPQACRIHRASQELRWRKNSHPRPKSPP